MQSSVATDRVANLQISAITESTAPPAKRANVAEITLLRAIGVVGVVSMHVAAAFLPPKANLEAPSFIFFAFADQAMHYAVPIFFFVSGFAAFYNHPRWEGFSTGRYLRQRGKRIIPSYVAWTTIYYLVLLGARLFTGDVPRPSQVAVEFAQSLLLGCAWYHLYFLVLIIQFYVLFPVLLFLWSRRPAHLKWWVVASFASQVLLSSYIHYWYRPMQPGIIDEIVSQQPRLFPFYIFYFVLGAYLTCRLPDIKRASRYLPLGLVLIAISAVALSVQFLYSTIVQGLPAWPFYISTRPSIVLYSTICIFSLWWLSTRLTGRRWLSTVLSALGQRSYGIYLIHPLVLGVTSFALHKASIELPPIVQGIILLGSVLFLSHVSVVVLDRVRVTRFLT